MKKGRAWAWSIVPLASILTVAVLPQNDEFADLARGGVAMTPSDFEAMRSFGGNVFTSLEASRYDDRIRVWGRPETSREIVDRLRKRGLRPNGRNSVAITRTGHSDFRVDYQTLSDDRQDTRIVVLEGTRVPKGSRCVVRVREARGIGPAWRRLVRRFKRAFGR